MFKSTKDFDSAIYKVLVSINNSVDITEIADGFSKEEFSDLIEYIDRRNLVNGIRVTGKNMSGTVMFGTVGTVRLTRAGLDFIENYKD